MFFFSKCLLSLFFFFSFFRFVYSAGGELIKEVQFEEVEGTNISF